MGVDLDQPAGLYVDLLGGLALLALALFVGLVRPRRAVNLAFAGYASSVGVAIAGANVLTLFDLETAKAWLFIVGLAAGGAFLVLVGFLLDRAVARRPRLRTWPILVASAVPYVVDRVLIRLLRGWDAGFPPGNVPFVELEEALRAIAFAGVFFAVALAAVRTRQGAWTMPPRVAALLSIGLVALPGFDAGAHAAVSIATEPWQDTLLRSLRVVAFLACGTAWLAAIPRCGRPAVAAGLACFLFPAIGALTVASPEGSALESFLYEGSFGVVAGIGVAVLAYAILRHQMFDVDVKLKWTLRRGTVAAVFLAVFFVVAQLAQNFLSDQYGWALGGAGAGLLLFLLAPIQRAAERLSDKAMPGVQEKDPAYVRAKKRETYRSAYAAAWSDGTMTQKDMRMLQQVREALGLPDKDVLAVEREWSRPPSTT